jgi:hypothetical protein
MREAGIAVGTLLDLARQEIVGLARPPARDRRIALLCTPGPAMDRTARAIPARSIASRRISPKSVKRASRPPATVGSMLPVVARQ